MTPALDDTTWVDAEREQGLARRSALPERHRSSVGALVGSEAVVPVAPKAVGGSVADEGRGLQCLVSTLRLRGVAGADSSACGIMAEHGS